MEDMKEFHDTHDSMSSWLSAKERMFTVLGPISSDSRMVQSQVQQVQVLREEFRTQQPQLQHLIDVGGSVLGYLDPRSPEGQKVDNKLRHIQNRWTDLLGMSQLHYLKVKVTIFCFINSETRRQSQLSRSRS